GIGGTGNIVVTESGQSLFVPAPKVGVISRVGAGDSFVGALVLSLAQGLEWSTALARGAAAASVAVTKAGTGLCEATETEAVAQGLNAVSV
ncbi:MAG: PfkB family carbohydrate kinase, partial [Pseudomonadota bacterium]